MVGRTAPKLFRARATQALAPREGGLASAQFRFDTPQLAAGSFITSWKTASSGRGFFTVFYLDPRFLASLFLPLP
jgi:hypothetical protein